MNLYLLLSSFSLSPNVCTVTFFILKILAFDLARGLGVWFEGPRVLVIRASSIKAMVLAAGGQHRQGW